MPRSRRHTSPPALTRLALVVTALLVGGVLAGAVPPAGAAPIAAPPAGSGPGAPTSPRTFAKPGWLPFRGTHQLGCVTTNCNGSGHVDWAMDIPFGRNEPVFSTGSGVVFLTVTDQGKNCPQATHTIEQCPDGAQGNAVVIDHGDGVYSFYGHLETVLVHAGQSVTEGTVIAGAGNSGWTDPQFFHLHYEEWNGLLWAGGVRTEPRDLKACHGSTTVTYPDNAGSTKWNGLPGFLTTLRHDGKCNPHGPQCISGFIDVAATHAFCPEITWMVGHDITDGFDDGLFKPSRKTSRQAAVAWLYRLAGSPAGPFPDPGFPDVGPSHPFYDEIAWAVDAGIVTGFDDGMFKDVRNVSRQAFLAWLHRLAGAPQGPFPDPGMSDVGPDLPFYLEISWAVDVGLADGYDDGSFQGSRSITRQAAAAFVKRFDDL